MTCPPPSPPSPLPPANSIHHHWLPYVPALASRLPGAIDLVVIHCTELPDLAMAREYGERALYPSGTGNSGHYYIDRDGSIECWVPETRIAHHVRRWNERSVGIELVNLGRWPDWYDSRRQQPGQSYPAIQMQSLIALLRQLARRFPVAPALAGHEDLDQEGLPASDDPALRVRRKLDPGPLFPWPQVLRESGLQRLRPDTPPPA